MEENQNQHQQQETENQIETNQTETQKESVQDQIADIQKQKEELEQLKKEMFESNVKFSLKENGLEAFAPIIKVENEDELKTVVQTLTKIVNDIKVSAGYVPSDHAKDNEYDVFAKNNDTKGMIATKLSKLFG